MCHHYDSEKLADWEREFETEDDEPSEEPELPSEDESEEREPATPPADD
jgi:hypothetical protein